MRPLSALGPWPREVESTCRRPEKHRRVDGAMREEVSPPLYRCPHFCLARVRVSVGLFIGFLWVLFCGFAQSLINMSSIRRLIPLLESWIDYRVKRSEEVE
jgi:hypothetical protein